MVSSFFVPLFFFCFPSFLMTKIQRGSVSSSAKKNEMFRVFEILDWGVFNEKKKTFF